MRVSDNHEVRARLEMHTNAELSFDLDAVMATVDDDPCFEWHPVGRAASGRDEVRRMYSVFLPRWRDLAESAALRFEVRSEFWNGRGRIREQVAFVRNEAGDLDRHEFVVVVELGEHGVTAERTYGAEAFHRLTLGSLFDELAPIDRR
jgi:hypothetical protein